MSKPTPPDPQLLADEFAEDGFVVAPRWLPDSDLADAVAGLPAAFPTTEAFHRDPAEPWNITFREDEFAGIRSFPFAGLALNLLAVHPRLIALAETLLGESDIRLYSAELWAKYTGAADYEQHLHRDYLNHTLMVPGAQADQVELFLYLHDVPEDLGPPRFVSRAVTGEAPPLPNWLFREEKSDWYEAEVSAAGPAGTVVAYRIDTFHRGTNLTRPRGARFTMHVSFRRASAEWASRVAWADHAHDPAWYEFVPRATPRALQLFGFPPPGHPYWTEATLAGTAVRYPGLDVSAFRTDECG